ncbi:expressed tetratricopeptide repeat protein [Nitzschia inconspicua]|uniref:Expressed tetratricopeptide repeat protein n=1 Tax=Nitzschia inconspicua TaxID=303405 RepID=A0A9K3LSC4_9STRA|nr:expressed tetratricopeptide repeat protein [Nitzschia inconspicua]
MSGGSASPQKPQHQSPSGDFPASANGGNGFTPITSSRSATTFQGNSNNPHGAAGKSCFVLPHLGTKKKKRTLRVSSSAASTADQSSTADPFQLQDSDQQSLLVKNKHSRESARGSRVNWYMETMPEVEENQDLSEQNPPRRTIDDLVTDASFTKSHTTPTKATSGTPPVTPSSSSSNEPAPSLLQFPTPQDRSHDARRMRTRSSGQMHAYQGELEPEGVRGQEATVLTTGTGTSAASPEIPLRSFDGSGSAPSIGSRVSQRRKDLQLTMDQDDRAAQESRPVEQQQSSSVNTTRVVTPSQFEQQLQERRRLQTSSQPNQSPDNVIAFNGRENKVVRQREESFNSFSEVVDSNVAEIAKEQNPSGSIRRPLQHSHLRTGSLSGTATDISAIHREHGHLPADPPAQLLSSPKELNIQERSTGPATPTDTSMQSSPVGSFRQSAPVNVDDSSFEDPNQHIQGIHAMAMEHVMRGEYDMALQAFTQVLRVYLDQYGRAHPLTASAYHNLGTVHTKRAGLLLDHTMHQRHCREQALLCFQAAARSARDSPQLGPDHPNVAVSLVRIGFLLLQSRQYQNAVITFEEALRIRLGYYGPTHSLVANLYNNQGVCHMHLQNFSVGRRYLQQALDIQKELLNQENYSSTALLELADTLCNIGGLNLEWIRQQGPDARHALDAESSFLEALEIRTKVLGEQHPLTNQVRSLHDMVRSIPLPKSVESSRQGDAPSQSLPQEYSPAGVSEMTFRSGASSPHSRRSVQKPNFLDPPHTPNSRASDGLNLPSLSRSAPTTPDRKMPPLVHTSTPSNKTNYSRSIGTSESRTKTPIIGDYDATEESCLLRRQTGDNVSSSQLTSIVVTYAQIAAAGSEHPSRKESDREATMRHAKAVLDAHRDFLDSPDNASRVPSSIGTRSHAETNDEIAKEDGFVPLAGNWPEPIFDNIRPEVLQDPTRHLQTIHDCAVSYAQNGRSSEAVHLFEMVVEVQKAKNGTLHEDVGCALHNVGVAYLRKKEYYYSLQAFEEAVRVRKGALGRDHPQVALSLVKVGICLLLLGRLQDSLWIFREALSVRKLALGSLHPSNARIYNNIGCCHVEFGELNEARRSFEAALDIQRNTLINDPDNAQVIFGASTTLQNLGYLYTKRDMHEKAAMVLRESLSLQEKILGEDHPTVMATLESLGEACLDARRFSHALKYYGSLFDRSQSNQRMSRMKQAKILHKISVIYEHMDNPTSQREKLELALRFLGSESQDDTKGEREALETKLQKELLLVKEEIEKKDESWV